MAGDVAVMAEARFWAVVAQAREEVGVADGARRPDEAAVLAALTAIQRTWPAGEILAWQRRFDWLHRESYQVRLWGAAYLVNGGCSDDGFDYFRGWLIVQGEQVFRRALAAPDSLADILTEDDADIAYLEEALSASLVAWGAVTGQGIQEFYAVLGPTAAPWPEFGEDRWSDSKGDMDEARTQREYPRLWELFGD